MIDYTPKPGSIAAKVIDHLTTHGGSLSPKDIFDLFGTPGKNLYPLLATPIRHGLIEKTGHRKKGVLFQLGGIDTSGRPPKPKRGSTGRTVANLRSKRLEVIPEPEEACGCLYSDNDVGVFGAVIAESGAVILSDGLARRLHRFLDRIYGPNA